MILLRQVLLCLLFCLTASICQAKEPIAPIPEKIETNPELVKLGKKLFFDTILSQDGTIACASCHNLNAMYGTDLSRVSTGIRGQKGDRNAPTVFNAAFDFRQIWDCRADTLADQAAGPVTNPLEHGMPSWDETVKKVAANKTYQKMFKEVLDGKITARNIQLAIAEFEKTQIAPNSPFDRFLKGDDGAISNLQKEGYILFKRYGCTACHQGANVGGNMYQKFGALKDINLHSGSSKQDLGRYEVTGNEWDKHVFKVPSLRLAVKTPPYFHDGAIATIEDAIDVMIQYQLDRRVPVEERTAIIAFLKSLVGVLPEVKP